MYVSSWFELKAEGFFFFFWEIFWMLELEDDSHRFEKVEKKAV